MQSLWSQRDLNSLHMRESKLHSILKSHVLTKTWKHIHDAKEEQKIKLHKDEPPCSSKNVITQNQ
jgi:hypothetical protein